ncbi:MAG: SH3 domain-containing protein [Candidatus Zixiibacteriota bacterium]
MKNFISNSSTWVLAAMSLIAILTIAGCGKKTGSTLPPVTEEVKSNDAAPVAPKEQAETETAAEAAEETQSGWVIKDLINVRSKASTSSDVVAQLPRGAEVKLLDYADKWWRVQLTDGRTAYVYETLLTKERYVDPWTRFKFDASRENPSLKIISGVAGIDGDAPSAAMTVSSDEWNSLAEADRTKTAEAAYAFWVSCLKKCGYETKGAVIVFRDSNEKQLGNIKADTGKPVFTAAE